MRNAILADIHSNLEALSAVLADIERRGGVDEYWVLGDLVNYGPDPSACLDVLRNLPVTAVSGNHDLAAVGMLPIDFFNPDAAVALEWTSGQLTKDAADFLRALPLTRERDVFTLVHGSPRSPAAEYLLSVPQARQNFTLLPARHAFFGHTHLPAAFKQSPGGDVDRIVLTPGFSLTLSGGRFMINPGSVGQPRDGDPRAACAVYDSSEGIVHFFRVEYDVKKTQSKMAAAGLPPFLISRLTRGL